MNMNTIKGLYKGRYLIAVYDREERLLGVANNVNELVDQMGLGSDLDKLLVHSTISRNHRVSGSATPVPLRNKEKWTLHFIDCLEEHHDCFEQEDKEFIEMCNETLRQTPISAKERRANAVYSKYNKTEGELCL